MKTNISNIILTAVVILLSVTAVSAQNRIVNGRVFDASKQALAGITVMASPTNGVVTDEKGNFSISLPSGPAELEFICLGYSTVRMTVQSTQDNLVVYMTEDAMNLQETVVVGYGVQKKVNLTGAVSTVTSKEISNRTSPTLTHMLQGSVPGLSVSTANGSPDDVASINIRGYNSINGGTPLVLIDGVEGDMSKINPQDVESVSVLKDASSAAIYGARASFGVVLITTKSGKDSKGKPVVRYSGFGGVSTPTTRTDYISTGYDSVTICDLFTFNTNGSNYTNYTEEDMHQLYIRRNDVTENPERPWILQQMRNGKLSYVYYCNTDWYKELYRTVNPFTQHNISVSGASEHFKYYVSGGYEHKEGTFRVRPDNYNKYTLRSKVEFNINKYISISDNVGFFSSDYDWPGNSNYNYTFMYSQVHGLASFPLKNPDGTNVYKTIFTDSNITNGCHIELSDDKKVNNIKKVNFSNTAEISIRPVEGLDIRANFTYMFDNSRKFNRWVPCSYSMYPGEVLTEDYGRFQNLLENSFEYTRYMAANVFATYSTTVDEKHNISAVAGYNYETQHYRYTYVSGRNLSSDYLSEFNLVQPNTAGNKEFNADGRQTEYALAGVFARLNYDYKGKYLFEVNGRFDGTSRFAPKSRWGFFPSASVGWKLSEENFWEPVKSSWDLFKLRFSYGALGNQQVSDYAYIQLVSTYQLNYLFNSNTNKPNGSYVGVSSMDGLTWETTYHYNLGLDLAFLGNRLAFVGDAYIRDTVGMITSGEAVPSVYGASAPSANAANLRSMGLELTLSWKDTFNLAGSPFTYGISVNYSDYITKLTKYKNPSKVLGSYYEGMTFGEIWGFRTDGLFASDAEAAEYTSRIDQSYVQGNLTGGWKGGDLRLLDLDNDQVISRGAYTVDNPGDLAIIGNSLPRYQYGVTLSAQWFGFDLSVFIQGVGKINWYPPADNQAFWVCFNRPHATYIPKNFMDNVWSEDNTGAYYPRPRGWQANEGTTYLTMVNDRYLQNLAYCRLKNLTFGYSLPDKVLRKSFVSALRIYFTGENLGYLSPLTKVSRYMDPEAMVRQNTFGYYYPYQKSFVLGLDITF